MQLEKKKEFLRAFKFLLFSISAGIIDMGSFALMDLIQNFAYVIKAYISITLSVLWNFTFIKSVYIIIKRDIFSGVTSRDE